MRLACLMSLLLPTLLFSTGPTPATVAEPDFSALEKVALAELAENNIPGTAIAIVSGDRVVFAKGFGVASVETGAPVTPDTLFQIGSVWSGAAVDQDRRSAILVQVAG